MLIREHVFGATSQRYILYVERVVDAPRKRPRDGDVGTGWRLRVQGPAVAAHGDLGASFVPTTFEYDATGQRGYRWQQTVDRARHIYFDIDSLSGVAIGLDEEVEKMGLDLASVIILEKQIVDFMNRYRKIQ